MVFQGLSSYSLTRNVKIGAQYGWQQTEFKTQHWPCFTLTSSIFDLHFHKISLVLTVSSLSYFTLIFTIEIIQGDMRSSGTSTEMLKYFYISDFRNAVIVVPCSTKVRATTLTTTGTQGGVKLL